MLMKCAGSLKEHPASRSDYDNLLTIGRTGPFAITAMSDPVESPETPKKGQLNEKQTKLLAAMTQNTLGKVEYNVSRTEMPEITWSRSLPDFCVFTVGEDCRRVGLQERRQREEHVLPPLLPAEQRRQQELYRQGRVPRLWRLQDPDQGLQAHRKGRQHLDQEAPWQERRGGCCCKRWRG